MSFAAKTYLMTRYNFALLFFPLFLFPLSVKSQEGVDTRILQPVAMQQDFNYLRKMLEDTHPGLYMHQSKESMQHKMDSLCSLLKQPMSFYQFYGIIAYLIAEVKCEHTSCSPYSESQFQANIKKWKLIPLTIYFSEHRAYVLVNRTSDTSIHLGDEVTAINHHSIDSLEKALFKYIPTDGDIETSKEQLLTGGMAFNIYYYLFLERPEAFDITFKTTEGQLKVKHWDKELTFAESNNNAIKNPVNKQIIAIEKRGSKDAADPWRLELLKDKQTAILTVRTFSGNKKQMYQKFERFFATIKQHQITNLIIDLDHNGGGDEAAAAELFSYLIDAPSPFINAEYLITDKDDYLKLANIPDDMLNNKTKYLKPETSGKFFVKEETQGELAICNPKANHFTGKVYFYIDGGTSSAASTLAAVAQSKHIGTFIGEETGGTYFGGGSAVGLNLTLPNSGITAHTSILYTVFATQGNHDKNRGVIPEYHFVPSFADLISANNGWKEYILKLIRNI